MSQETVRKYVCVDQVLEWLVCWVLAASAVGMASTLADHFMALQVCIVATVITGIYAWLTRERLCPVLAPNAKHVVFLILVCLFFRLPVFNYVLGGQDEGIYVNMAHYIEQTGGIVVHDTTLEKLEGSPFVGRYLAENRSLSSDPTVLGAGQYVNGVYVSKAQGSRLEFQFYDLFPVWMAISAGVFGATFAVNALTLFALLSVIFMYRLALVLTDSTRAALTAGLLLALNPLHAFFSKFPVTEVPTLAFSLIGFTYLALSWRAVQGGSHRRWLWLSLLGFGALFMTRISGFMYVPFFVAMAVAGAVVDADRPRQRSMQWWVVAVILFYAASVAYGLHWSHQYSHDIYRTSFQHIFPRHWQTGVAIAMLAGLLIWGVLVAFAHTRRRGNLERFLVSPARQVIGLILIIGLAIGLYRIYELGWTSRYVGDYGLDTVWGLAESRWRALRASSLAAVFVYLGPLLPLAFVSLALRLQAQPMHEFLRLLTVGFLVYILVLQWVVPYGPYYARYLLSEIVPYMLLFTVVVWSRMPPGVGRRAMNAVLAITLIYSAGATATQLGKTESAGLYKSLGQLLAPVDSADVVLLDVMGPGLPDNSEIKTPIKFTFGLSAVTVSQASLADLAYMGALNARYDDVFLVSPSAVPPQGFDYAGRTRIRVSAFEWTHSFPHKTFLREDMDLYLYRLATPIFPLEHVESFAAPGAWNNWLASGWSTPESVGVWSSGNHTEIAIDPRQIPHVKGDLQLTFTVGALLTPAHAQQRVRVSVDGVAAAPFSVRHPDQDVQIKLDIPAGELTGSQRIRIDFDLPDATTPKSLGINGDERVLGILLKTLTAAPATSESQVSDSPGAKGMRSSMQRKPPHTQNEY